MNQTYNRTYNWFVTVALNSDQFVLLLSETILNFSLRWQTDFKTTVELSRL